MKRIALALAILLVAVVAAVVYFVRFSLDGAVKSAIERHGSEMAGTAVRVEGVEIELTAGRGTIRGITVANPAGFSSAAALSLSAITLDLDPTSLAGSPVVVEEIRVGEPLVNVELAADGRTNVEQLRKNLDAYGGRAGGGGKPAAHEGESSETRLRVREVSIAEGTIRLDAQALGREPEELRLGSVELRDVGRERGATPEELGRAVTDALVARTLRAVAGAQAKRALKDFGGEVGEKLGELLQRGIDP